MAKICCIALLFLFGCAGQPKVSESTQAFLTSLEFQSSVSELKNKLDDIDGKITQTRQAVGTLDIQLKASQVESETSDGIGGDLECDPSPNAETVVNESRGSSPGSQPVSVPAVELSSAPSRQWWLVSEEWCVNCPAAKAAFLAKGWPESNVLTVDQCESKFGFRVPYVPYEFGDPNSKVVSMPWPKKQDPVRTSGPMSTKEMLSLHNKLHGGGQWTWPGDLATHLATTHGVSTGGAPLTGAFFPVQGQAAITNSRSTVRSVSPGQRFVGRARVTSGKSCPSGRCP